MDLETKINELFESTPEYINGVSFGFKQIKGEYSNELAIVFHINKKKPISSLSKDELIPEFININGKNYPTDIIESSIAKNLACYNISKSNPSQEVLPHRIKQRPIKGGIVIAATNNCGYSYDEKNTNKITPYRVGTLGCLVVDNETNTLVGLTAGHVLSREILRADLVEINSLSTNILYPQKLRVIDSNKNLTSSTSIHTYPQQVYQFTESSGYIDISSNDSVGIPKRYVSLNTGTNYSDAGIFILNKNSVNITGSNVQLGLTGTLNMPFATNDEIYDIFSNQYNIYSAGRTTGPKGDICNLKIKSLYTAKTVSGYTIIAPTIDVPINLYFRDLIGFGDNGNTEYPSADGDSGAILYANHSGQNKIIGLVFAGSESGNNLAYACNINRVTGDLNISSWNGGVKNFDNPISRRGFITSPTSGAQIFINKDNIKYYQAGAVSNFTGPVTDSSQIENTVFNTDGSITINPIINDNLLDDNSNSDTISIEDNDIFLKEFAGTVGNASYSVIANGLLTDSNLNPISNATIIYKIEYLDSSSECCVESSNINCTLPNILRGYSYKLKTNAQGVFTIAASNNKYKDSVCFRVKILDAVKPSYNFRPDLSIKNEVFICASAVTPVPPVTPPVTPPVEPPVEPPFPPETPEPPETPINGGGGGGGEGEGGGTIVDPPPGGYVSCCEYPENIKNNFEARLNMTVYCSGPSPRVRIGADLVITKNPLTCKGANLSASLGFGGRNYKFNPWITINTSLVSTPEIILSPNDLNLILNAAENTGGKSPVVVNIDGSLNNNISDQCRDEKLRNKHVSFNPDVKISFVSWNESVSSDEEVSGPHCIGTIDSCGGGQNSKKCPAKCCECCETMGQDLIGTLVKPTKILVYSKNDGTYIFRSEENPCPDRHPVNTIINKNLYTCPFDCECNNDQKNQPILEGTGVKGKLSCERGAQKCFQCILKEEGDCEYSYTSFISSSLPLSLEDLINQNLTN